MAKDESAIRVWNKVVPRGEELGRDCTGTLTKYTTSQASERSSGLASAVSGQGRDRWPVIGKTAEWILADGGKLYEEWIYDWGRSEEDRVKWRKFTGWNGDPVTNAAYADKVYLDEITQKKHRKGLMNTRARRAWLDEHPTWWDEKRREAEVDASPQVAGEMTDMGLDNRSIVAGHLAKTVEGGEVVEIRDVSSTSVMVNACYDAELGNMSVIPYACLGFGGNFVGVGGSVAPKLAYKLKAGVAYRLSTSISAYLGAYYHHVMGDGQYTKLPVYRLVDDISPEGRTQY